MKKLVRKYWCFYYNQKDIPSLVVLLKKRMNGERKWLIFKVLLSKIDWGYLDITDVELYAKECGNQVLLSRAFSHMARLDRGKAFQMVSDSKRRSFNCG